jgi:uncharacterized protein
MKYVKMIGLVLLYTVIPFGFFFLAILTFKNVKFLGSLYNLSPGAFWLMSDPLLITTFFLFFKFAKKQSFAKFANIVKIDLSRIIIFICFGLFLGLFSYSFVSLDIIRTNFKPLTDTIKGFIAVGNVFFLILLVPINSTFKEVAYRGAIFNEMKGKIPLGIALIIQALCYTATVFPYSPMPVTIYALLGAIMFGLIYYLGGSLWASIITQFCTTFTLIALNKSVLSKVFSNQVSVILVVISVIMLLILFVVLIRKNKEKIVAQNKEWALQ